MSDPTPTLAYVALGANLGDRAGNIFQAVAKINATPGLRVRRISPLIDNDAVGGPPDSPPFLNGVAEIQATILPQEILARLLAIETELGRIRGKRWEPRLIDLDLLLYGTVQIDEPGLTLPHPRLHERRFVLQPLAKIAPKLVHPTLGKTMQALLDELPLGA
jgi:2-amino-4-hydroxy-6-hydroxymethyldihydropteridine diphosphokinase